MPENIVNQIKFMYGVGMKLIGSLINRSHIEMNG